MEYDLKATASAEIGTIFTILATVTGMIWAKLNWGSFWNWDPRETSIFILLLIYGAYFALRSALENEELKARLSSVYSIIAFITVPFFVFILPRLLTGLHPGSSNDNSSGPVVSTQANTLNFLQQITFSLGFTSISLIFFWMLNIRYRMKKLINHIY
jgi:heme exporter protein C